MIVVIRKDDYGTPVVFVECWGGPWWWCWWVDVSEKPTKRRGRTKKLRREEMLNERKRIIQNWQKRIWKVESSSPQQRASRARSPGSHDGQQETHVQLVPGQRQEAAQEVGGVIRQYDNNMILLSNTFQVIVTSPRHGQHQPAASVGHQRKSQDVAEVGGWVAAPRVRASPSSTLRPGPRCSGPWPPAWG